MSDVTPSVPHSRSRLWVGAVTAGAVAATILYRARIGINVALWTGVATLDLALVRGNVDPATRRRARLPLTFAILLAIGAGVTAAPEMQAWLVVAVLMLLALATRLLALSPSAERYDAIFIATAPPLALVETLRNGARAVVQGIGSIGVLRRRPALRGALLGAVIVIVFAALFADADPLFARGRDAVTSLLGSVDIVPRLLFFSAATFGVLGAYAYAARIAGDAAPALAPPSPPRATGDRADRAVVLACAAAVCWLFVALQLAYVATDAPSRPGSGVTYAAYAHRGFAQLSVAATLAVLLVVEALGRGRSDDVPTRLRALAFALLAAVSGVLVSAFHRVTLYENVYGFTTARVEAQAYMLCVFAVLVLCAIETARGFDTARLARATMTVALTALFVFGAWNDQAWVVRKDVARFAGSPRLDVEYLARLAPDAYPAILDALARLPDAQRQQLASALWPRAMCAVRDDAHWFEWNASRARARAAFRSHGFALPPDPGWPGYPCSVD